MNKQTVAVVFGGRSTEHDVSIVTAISAIIKPLELTQKYKVLPIYITKQGDWYADDKLKDINLYTSGKLEDTLTKLKPASFSFDKGFQVVTPGLKQKKIDVDIVFPSMHGTYGEDGSLMGMLRMANVPFVGCDMAASAAAMDKVTSKLLAEAHGLPITKMQFITKADFEAAHDEFEKHVNKELKYPLFVKPAHLGSSIGLARVDKPEDLMNAMEVAMHYDDKILVEEGVENLIEVTLPIMGNEEPVPAMLEQPELSDEGVFDFDTKYMRGGKKGGKGGGKVVGEAEAGSQGYSIIPAKIDQDLYDKAVELGVKAYQAIGCEGYARIDMLIDSKTNEIYFNEVNPLPGSLYAHNWQKAGVSKVELVEKLIDYAVSRHNRNNKQSVVFETSFLNQF